MEYEKREQCGIGNLRRVMKDPQTIQDLVKRDPNLSIKTHTIPWNTNAEVTDISLNPEIRENELFMAKNIGYYLNIPNGNTIVNIYEGNKIKDSFFARQGQKHIYNFHPKTTVEDLCEDEHSQQSLSITGNILADVQSHLQDQKRSAVNIYELKKLDGVNIQITFNDILNCWVIGQDSVSIFCRDDSDIKKYQKKNIGKSNTDILKFSRVWFDILNKCPISQVRRLEEDLNGFCQIAEGIDHSEQQTLLMKSGGFQHKKHPILKYIGFSKILAKSDVVPCNEVFEYLQDYGFALPEHKFLGRFTNWIEFDNKQKQVSLDIRKSSIDQVGKGSVIVLIKENSEGSFLSSGQLQITSLDYEILHKFELSLRQGLSNNLVQSIEDILEEDFDKYLEEVAKLQSTVINGQKLMRDAQYYNILGTLGKLYLNWHNVYLKEKRTEKQIQLFKQNHPILARDLIRLIWYIYYTRKDSNFNTSEIVLLFENYDLINRVKKFDLDILTYEFTGVSENYPTVFRSQDNLLQRMYQSEMIQGKLLDNQKLYSIYRDDDRTLVTDSQVLFIIPLSIPGSGKSYFKDKLGQAFGDLGLDFAAISSDKAQDACRDFYKKRYPNKTFTGEELHELTRHICMDLWDLELAKLLINNVRSPLITQFVYIDKNHFPQSLTQTITQINTILDTEKTCFQKNYDRKFISIAPKTFKKNLKEDILPDFPQSIHYLLNCLQRLLKRGENHETLHWKGIETMKIVINIFFNSFKNKELNISFLRQYGVHNSVVFPMTNCISELSFENSEELTNQVDTIVNKKRTADDSDWLKLEKIVKDTDIGDLHISDEDYSSSVEYTIKKFLSHFVDEDIVKFILDGKTLSTNEGIKDEEAKPLESPINLKKQTSNHKRITSEDLNQENLNTKSTAHKKVQSEMPTQVFDQNLSQEKIASPDLTIIGKIASPDLTIIGKIVSPDLTITEKITSPDMTITTECRTTNNKDEEIFQRKFPMDYQNNLMNESRQGHQSQESDPVIIMSHEDIEHNLEVKALIDRNEKTCRGDLSGCKNQEQNYRNQANDYNKKGYNYNDNDMPRPPRKLPLYLSIQATSQTEIEKEIWSRFTGHLEKLAVQFSGDKRILYDLLEIRSKNFKSWNYPKDQHITTLFVGKNRSKWENNWKYIENYQENTQFPFCLSGFAYLPGGIQTGIVFVDKDKVIIDNKYPHMTCMTSKLPAVASNDQLCEMFNQGKLLSSKYDHDKIQNMKAPLKIAVRLKGQVEDAYLIPFTKVMLVEAKTKIVF